MSGGGGDSAAALEDAGGCDGGVDAFTGGDCHPGFSRMPSKFFGIWTLGCICTSKMRFVLIDNFVEASTHLSKQSLHIQQSILENLDIAEKQ